MLPGKKLAGERLRKLTDNGAIAQRAKQDFWRKVTAFSNRAVLDSYLKFNIDVSHIPTII